MQTRSRAANFNAPPKPSVKTVARDGVALEDLRKDIYVFAKQLVALLSNEFHGVMNELHLLSGAR